MGISEVLGHQSALAQQMVGLRSCPGSMHAGATVARLAALQTSLMQQLHQELSPQEAGRQLQQLLLSLGELQREVGRGTSGETWASFGDIESVI